MDELEQRQHNKEEFAKLDALRMDHARLAAKTDFIEAELREHKSFVQKSISDLDAKIDKLHERFDSVSGEVKTLALKVAYGAIIVGFVGQILLKHYGLL